MSEENEKKVLCESCGYFGDIDTYEPSMSIYSDCRCPKCYSTNNQHNSEYQKMLNKAFNDLKKNKI